MENIPRYIKRKMRQLDNSNYTFEALFDIIHDQDDRIFCEYIENFRIKEVKYSDFADYARRAGGFYKKSFENLEISEQNPRIGIYLENSLNFIAAFWGVLMAGGRPVLLNCRLPIEVNRDIIKITEIQAVIAGKGFESGSFRVPVIAIDNINNFLPEIMACEPLKNCAWGDEIALSTTATSLDYKICVYTGRDFTYQARNAKGILEKNKMIKRHCDGRLKQLAFLPFYHIFGLLACYFWFAIFGRTFVFLHDYSSETILNTVKRHKVTHIFAVPLLWNTVCREIKKELDNSPKELADKAKKGFELSLKIQSIFPEFGAKISRKLFSEITNRTFGDSVRFLISGGGQINDETLKMINALGYPLYNGYGSSEIGITSVELRESAKKRIEGSIGRPFDSVSYKIENGVLFVRGNSTCSYIISKDGATHPVSKDEWFNTKDCSTVDKDGNYFLQGRQDDVIVGENGEKINPDMVEKQLLFTKISEFSILSYNGSPALIFSYPKGTNELVLRKICNEIDSCRQIFSENNLSGIKIYCTDDRLSPENAIKVSRKLLLKNISEGKIKLLPYSELSKEKQKSTQELSESVVRRVKEIFARVLCCDVALITNDGHFIFDLGGSSLDYCTLLLKLKEEFGTDVSAGGHSTVNEFAAALIASDGGL